MFGEISQYFWWEKMKCFIGIFYCDTVIAILERVVTLTFNLKCKNNFIYKKI